MHDMLTIVTDVCCVSLSVSLLCSSTGLYCVKTAERFNILFGVNTLRGPWNIVLHGVLIPPERGGRGVGNFANCEPTAYLRNG